MEIFHLARADFSFCKSIFFILQNAMSTLTLVSAYFSRAIPVNVSDMPVFIWYSFLICLKTTQESASTDLMKIFITVLLLIIIIKIIIIIIIIRTIIIIIIIIRTIIIIIIIIRTIIIIIIIIRTIIIIIIIIRTIIIIIRTTQV